MTNASNTAKAVPSTPKTPAARSRSVKNPPSGARRRASHIRATAASTATKTTAAANQRFTPGTQSARSDAPTGPVLHTGRGRRFETRRAHERNCRLGDEDPGPLEVLVVVRGGDPVGATVTDHHLAQLGACALARDRSARNDGIDTRGDL